MAILNNIRKRGVFLIVIIALALFSFVLADVIRNGGFSTDKSQTTIATVNGIDIPRQEFMERVEAYKQAVGPSGNSSQATNLIWEQELRSVLLQEQYDELGIVVSEEAMDDALRTSLSSNTTFQNQAGQYDPARIAEYQANIQNNSQALGQWNNFLKNTRRSILETTYLNMVRSGMVSTLADGEQEYRFENDKINIEYVHIPYSSIADEDIVISDSDIATYVKEHPNDFEVEPQVDIQYVSFNEEPSEADIEAARVKIAALLNETSDDLDNDGVNEIVPGFEANTNHAEFVSKYSDIGYNDSWLLKSRAPQSIVDTLFALDEGSVYGPYKLNNAYNLSKVVAVAQKYDSVNSKHILIRFQGSTGGSSGISRTNEEAKALADSLLTAIKSDKSKFESLAASFSEDLTNKDNGGELGYFGPGAMVPTYDSFIFDNGVGSVGVVETDFGFHVVKIEDQKNLQKVIKLATVSQEIEPSEETINQLFADATKLEVAAQDGNFSDLATEAGSPVKPVNKIGELDAIIPGIGENRSIVTWAFDDENKVGDVKRFNVPNGYIIAQLTRRNPKGLMSVAEASASVTPILRTKKKAERIMASATGTTLQEVATGQNVTVKNATALTQSNPTIAGAGTEPKVVGTAFGKKAGEDTGLIEGVTGVFKVRVLAVNPAPELTSYEAYAKQANDKVSPLVNNGVYTALKNAADIEDNRSTIF